MPMGLSLARHAGRIAALLLGLGCGVAAADAQTQRVENVARLSFSTAAGTQVVRSNAVALEVMRDKRPTTLGFRRLPAGYQPSGGSCQVSPSPHYVPAPVDEATLAAAPPLQALDTRTPMIIVLDADASNRDPAVRETMAINGATGRVSFTLPLMETAPDSGVFAGAVPAASGMDDPALAPCSLGLRRGDMLRLTFVENDFSLPSAAAMLIDPAGYVFDSRTGKLIDGATISLVDEAGRPAKVFGDDGKSAYPSTVVSGAEVRDASGRLYPAHSGHYRFPLTFPGRYHLVIAPPGDYTAPSTADRQALGELRDPVGLPFILNEASFGGAIVLDNPDPFFADIPLDGPRSETLLLTKTASVRDAAPGDFVQYRLVATNRGSQAQAGVTMVDTLPRGLRYEQGSTRGVPEPEVASDARTLRFALPALDAGQSAEISYVVSVAPGAPQGEALNRARLSGTGGASSNEAAASVRVRPLLFSDAMTVVGRVTEGDCRNPLEKRRGVAGVRILMEDGTFVVTDRDGLYHLEGVRPGTHVVQMDRHSLPATHEPVACDADTRQAGNALSRFVEGVGGVLKRVDFQLRPTGRKIAAADVLPITVADDAVAAGNRDWLPGLTPGIDWVFPQADHNPRVPMIRVAIKHAPGQRVALTVNGAQTDPVAFDGTSGDVSRGVVLSRWSGLSLIAGDNRLVARVLDAAGGLVTTLERVVHVGGAPVRAVLDPAKSRLAADGLTRPLLAVRVTDKDGRPVVAGTSVPFRVDQPYRAAVDAALEQGQQVAGREKNQIAARVVGDEGYAFLPLEPTTQAGAVRAEVLLTEGKQVRTSELRAWLEGAAQGWTMVGFGAGTIGYDTLSHRASDLPGGEQGKVVTDGQLAFYAKGRVKGSWLLTIAYDSDRRYDPDRGLLGTIDPDRYYTVYGDGAQQGYDAATRRTLYLRLERREFYALFGDFETGLTETQLTRYSRTLNGVKAAYEGEQVRAAGFAATTDTLYSRDEIQGNGLSGPYRLSGRDIVPNSDKLRIEVRDRFRSERIVSSRGLARHIDYDIDAARGTIRFREPVLSRDEAANPIFIVADYEVEGGRAGKLVAAGRVAARTAGDRIELGVGAIRDETAGIATVIGADVTVRADADTELRGEIATGGKGGLRAGIAYLAEVEHHGGSLDLLAYVRQQDAGFGVGQQNIVEAATRKVGLDGRLALSDRLSLTGTGWYQDMLASLASRVAGDMRLEYRRPAGTLFVGAQLAMDRGRDGGDRNSRLLTLGGTQRLFGDKLTLSAQTQVAPGGDQASVDFPARHQITAGYKLSPGVRLLAGYEIAEGEAFTSRTGQIGFDVAPWRGAKLMSTLNQQGVQGGENGGRTFAQYGLSQSLPIGRHWTIDATLDASSTVKGDIPQGGVVNAFQPVASGGLLGQDQLNGDYVAATLGATYRAARWTWTGRLERRTADAGNRWGLTSSFLRSLGEGKTLASGIRAYSVQDQSGAVASYISADVALALRPLDSRWSVLERLELRHDRADRGFSSGNVLGVPASGVRDQVTTRAINNLAVNYRAGAEGQGHGVEGSIYYGSKYVVGRYGEDEYTGYVDVTGFELRADLGPRLDLGIQGSVQHAWERGVWSWSVGPSAGISPAADLWVSAGYNLAGYRDRDFEDDRYAREGPYVTMRMKFDQAGIAAAGRRLIGAGR